MACIYLIGSMRNPEVPKVAQALRLAGHEVYDDWYATGPESDDYWQKYEEARGHSFIQALEGYAAQQVFTWDRRHLDRCDTGLLVLPAGKSAHLELGYMVGKGKRGYILLDKPPARWDVMFRFADGVYETLEDLLQGLKTVTPGGSVLSPWNSDR